VCSRCRSISSTITRRISRPSTIDIHLEDGVGDEEYLERLGEACRRAFDEFRPQLLMYVAGADPYCQDQLGGLTLTMEGLRSRDRLVLSLAREHNTPVAITLAGGYAMDVADTVTIHTNTARVAAETLQG
jgi:acetoin utilization deacetylase AcuC-like enzyme